MRPLKHLVWPVALAHALCAGAASGAERPNFLFILTDDQSWPHAGAYGDPVVQTPAIDRLAEEGVLFTHSFTATPSCTGSRSAILAGQDIWRLRQAGILHGSIPPDLDLFPLLLEDAGYFVGFTGKGWNPGSWDYLGLERYPIGREFNDRLDEKKIAEGISPVDYAANFDDFLAARRDGQPFFFWLGTREPHRKYQYGAGQQEAGLDPARVRVPAYLPDSDVVRQDLLDYYYEIQWLDTHIESVLAALEEAGELDNTIVVVTSDNGLPFPRGKTTLYDAGTRMPLVIRWGKGIAHPGRVVDDLVMHTDFAPTFLALAGLGIPAEVTGRSLLPLLQSDASGVTPGSREYVVTAIERHTYTRPGGGLYPSRAIRTREFLYIRNYEPDAWPTGGPDFVSSNKTTHGDIDDGPTKRFMTDEENQRRYAREYQLSFGKRPAEELYEIASDPDQVNNLAGDPRYEEIRRDLAQRLERHLSETGDPRMREEAPWKDYIYHQYGAFGSNYNRSLPEDERRRARLRPGSGT
jgi:N-sulfoglucosamine sulfohydrolase